jgi:SAM-dependent methyltransferase
VRAGVRNYKVDFLRPYTPLIASCHGDSVEAEGERRLGSESAEISFLGPWTAIGDRMAALGEAESTLVYEGDFSGASLRLLTHPWSGIVSVQCDDDAPFNIDLYRPEESFIIAVAVAQDLSYRRHRLVLRTTGRRNAASLGPQVFFQELVLRGPINAGFDPRIAKNYGNPYSSWILRHLGEIEPDPLILEVGGGDRRTANPRHINLEYLEYDLPDAFGDIHNLPFRDCTFDGVFTQAVFEHLRNPYAAAAELIRVVRPGGAILTEVAFLQPLHGVPNHYFNMTIDGLKAIFHECRVFDEGWFGDFSQTVSWMANVSGVKDRLPPDSWGEIARLLSLMDEKLDDNGRKFIASGVRLAAWRC